MTITYRNLSHDKVYEDKKLLKRLRFLTNGGWGRAPKGSAFLEDLSTRRSGDFFLAEENEVVVGWAFLTDHWAPARKQVGVYIARGHRGQGIAQNLLENVKSFVGYKSQWWTARYPKLVGCPWTPQGSRLFAKLRIPTTDSWY